MSERFHPVTHKIEAVLRDGGFWYERFEHEPVRTSEEAARVRPEYNITQGTKSLIVKAKRPHEEKRFIMVVVPGDKRFDRKLLKRETGYDDARFATPEEVAELTGGIVPGGVPPFGNLFGIPVFADAAVFANERIIFNAGDRSVSIAMRSKDYRTLVAPGVFPIA
jgi:prolyl-tRNA editing enzyme YbaK/EbsC (Cys-tRNA(Pro) deacylase)